MRSRIHLKIHHALGLCGLESILIFKVMHFEPFKQESTQTLSGAWTVRSRVHPNIYMHLGLCCLESTLKFAEMLGHRFEPPCRQWMSLWIKYFQLLRLIRADHDEVLSRECLLILLKDAIVKLLMPFHRNPKSKRPHVKLEHFTHKLT